MSPIRWIALVLIASAGVVLSSARFAEARGPDGAWAPPTYPSLSLHVAVWDSLRARTVVVGGYLDTSPSRTVYTLAPDQIVPFAPLDITGEGPTPRVAAAAVFDPVGDRLVLFGGRDAQGEMYSDAWTLDFADGGSWHRLSPAGTGPTPRAFASAVFDRVRRRMIVFGGIVGDTVTNEVWALDLSATPSWSQITSSGPAPGRRWQHGAIWDAARNRMIVFGGIAEGAFNPSKDTWALEFSGAPRWVALATTGTRPHERSKYACVLDPVRDRMLIYGGDGGGYYLGDVWAFSLATNTWSAVNPSGGPPAARTSAPAVYDSRRDQMIVVTGLYRRDVWALGLAAPEAWTPLVLPSEGPPKTRATVVVFDPVRDRMFAFGGDDTMSDYGGSWVLQHGPNPRWTKFVLPGAPVPRYGSSGFYDPLRDRILLCVAYRSASGSGLPDVELWSLSLTEPMAWSRIEVTGAWPSPRTDARIVYDADLDQLVFCGAEYFGGPLVVWTLPLGSPGPGVQVPVTGTLPVGVAGEATLYDPVRHRLLVYGASNDTLVHALGLSHPFAWQAFAPVGAGPGRLSRHSMVHDPIADRALIFGGSSGSTMTSDVWELSLGDTVAWRRFAPGGDQPGVLEAHGAYFDPIRDRMAIFGGLRPPWPDQLRYLEWGRGLRPRLTSAGDVSWFGGLLQARWNLENPLSTPRTYRVTLSSARAWPDFPVTYLSTVPARTTASLLSSAVVPDTATPGSNHLVARAELLGSPGFADTAETDVYAGGLPGGAEGHVVSATPDEVRLEWNLADGDRLPRELFEWTAAGWRLVRTLTPSAAGVLEFVDDAASPGTDHVYALRLLGEQGSAWEGFVSVRVPIAPSLALSPATNPAADEVAMWVTVPHRGDYELRLVDVAGRTVWREVRQAASAGAALVRIRRLSAPGIYWARLEQAGTAVTSRVVLLR